MSITAADILDVTKNVTKEWTKQRKAEERGNRCRASRAYVYSDRVDCTAVADAILPGGYDHASGGGKYTVSKRTFFYAVRDAFKLRTGRELKFSYFAGTLLVQFINRRPDKTVAWKVTADLRGGTAGPPQSGALRQLRVPCGDGFRSTQPPECARNSAEGGAVRRPRRGPGWLIRPVAVDGARPALSGRALHREGGL